MIRLSSGESLTDTTIAIKAAPSGLTGAYSGSGASDIGDSANLPVVSATAICTTAICTTVVAPTPLILPGLPGLGLAWRRNAGAERGRRRNAECRNSARGFVSLMELHCQTAPTPMPPPRNV